MNTQPESTVENQSTRPRLDVSGPYIWKSTGPQNSHTQHWTSFRPSISAYFSTVVDTDPFHVAKWATDALDEVRRTAWNDARKAARQHDARCTRCRPAVPAAGPPPTLRPDRIVLELPASRTAATRSGRTRRT
ncbi:hypothetical protein E3O32_04715 [Cryobacterium mannosilyticum]|uniref:Transposase IS204/IS1001/IS1096/IS1165 DDE domain-containing protein n=1 Tax=Cryobacterium mannosilyticum TaxID=1259190 RepID=A0A4V3IDE6_9MICO|nr:hypothetical protein E3O32_04715 [Cryobacterium mannosilyticum]